MATANLVTNILANSTINNPTVTLGMGATVGYYTDREAGTVIKIEEIRGVKYITIQEDKATRTDDNGMSDSQTYEYECDEKGRTWSYRFRNGKWEHIMFNKKTNRWNKEYGPALILGRRNKFYDYSF